MQIYANPQDCYSRNVTEFILESIACHVMHAEYNANNTIEQVAKGIANNFQRRADVLDVAKIHQNLDLEQLVMDGQVPEVESMRPTTTFVLISKGNARSINLALAVENMFTCNIHNW